MGLILTAGLSAAGCTPPAPLPLDYRGVEVTPLDDSLISVSVTMAGVSARQEVITYADCAIAQHSLDNGYNFARPISTKTDERGGIWRGDAVYTISKSFAPGPKTLEADIVVSSCAETGVPTM